MIVTEIEDGLLKKVKEYGRKIKEEVPVIHRENTQLFK